MLVERPNPWCTTHPETAPRLPAANDRYYERSDRAAARYADAYTVFSIALYVIALRAATPERKAGG